MGHVARVAEHLCHQEGPVCDACLAADLALDVTETRRALARLGLLLQLRRGPGTCVRCARAAIVSGGLARLDTVEIGVADLLERRPGDRLCHRCLAEALGVPLADVRKGVAALRGRGICAVYAGSCSACRRVRVLVGLG